MSHMRPHENLVLAASMADGTQRFVHVRIADQFYPASATNSMQHPSGGDTGAMHFAGMKKQQAGRRCLTAILKVANDTNRYDHRGVLMNAG